MQLLDKYEKFQLKLEKKTYAQRGQFHGHRHFVLALADAVSCDEDHLGQISAILLEQFQHPLHSLVQHFLVHLNFQISLSCSI